MKFSWEWQYDMPQTGSFFRLYRGRDGKSVVERFKWVRGDLYKQSPDETFDLYRETVSDANKIARCCPTYKIIEESETTEINMSDKEYVQMVHMFVAKHMRPESIKVFNENMNGHLGTDVKEALWKAVINDIANDVIQEVIENG